ncbi:hypothetical protein RCC89_02145 [Cytophagaceae bacterium ABcell3]|nr:hypothetical protein RCC89_02145 [Cytophagaceae bacterium ABcell3]
MHKVFLVLFLTTILFSCRNLREDITTFSIQESSTFEIEPVTGVDVPIVITSIPVETSASESFEQEGVTRDNIEEIRLMSMSLIMLDPPEHTFNFVKSLELTIVADGLPERKLAYHHDVPRDVTDFDLEITGENLDEYLKKDKFYLNVSTTSRVMFDEKLQIKADMIFNVRAKIFN